MNVTLTGGYPISLLLPSLLLAAIGSMVISAETQRQPPDPMSAAAPPARTEAFSFPILEKWGSQRVLHCLNVNRKGELIKSPPRPPPRFDPIGPDEDDGALNKVREKLLVHLREAEDRVKLPEAVAPPPPPTDLGPWNLRARRTPVKDPSVWPPWAHVRTVRLTSEDAERRDRPRFSVSLTREEIDEDIYAVTGARARRRPKKRRGMVQKQLDANTIFFGLNPFQFRTNLVLISKRSHLSGR